MMTTTLIGCTGPTPNTEDPAQLWALATGEGYDPRGASWYLSRTAGSRKSKTRRLPKKVGPRNKAVQLNDVNCLMCITTTLWIPVNILGSNLCNQHFEAAPVDLDVWKQNLHLSFLE
ncbi:hypothetical protein AVEN_180222-1 [Araneus ventricosus]|uniref:Uncharacterized protein n=1 Tax=Araneus ventricosus TaxID=182803 RepID=A0A4Y2N027_ARAVE|nr:hypothetical protein AVEN_180222-1 [Araneus ventricosus]